MKDSRTLSFSCVSLTVLPSSLVSQACPSRLKNLVVRLLKQKKHPPGKRQVSVKSPAQLQAVPCEGVQPQGSPDLEAVRAAQETRETHSCADAAAVPRSAAEGEGVELKASSFAAVWR